MWTLNQIILFLHDIIIGGGDTQTWLNIKCKCKMHVVRVIKCNEIYYKCISLALVLALLVAFGLGVGVGNIKSTLDF